MKPIPTTNLVFGTDGSGGPASKDKRLRQCSFAVVALNKDTRQAVATLTGSIQGSQTVPRAEAAALLWLLKLTTGPLESSIDAQAVLKRWKKLPQPKATSNMDLWGPITKLNNSSGAIQTFPHGSGTT